MTESGLLLLLFVKRFEGVSEPLMKRIHANIVSLVNWLYTTSGYYDKSIQGNKFNFDTTALTPNLNKFIHHLHVSVQGCHEAQFMFHRGFMMDLFLEVKEKFLKHLNISNFRLMNGVSINVLLPSIYTYIENKRVLVVSSFESLIKKQCTENRLEKIGLGFPKIECLVGVRPPYCFFNNGPHNNYFETLASIFKEVREKKDEFDVVLLGCGCYGHMLSHMIHEELNKDAIYIGGDITTMFGILSTRARNHVQDKVNEYWVTDIPDELKPNGYKDIEGGCYW